jgi:hypothetical protein
LACECPHLCAPPLGMCAPSLGTCAPSLGMCVSSLSAPLRKAMSLSNNPPYACVLLSFCPSLPCGIVGCTLTWHVRAVTWHVRALTWHVRALSATPLQKAMSVSNYPPYPCVLLPFCLPLPCGMVGSTLTWHMRAPTWNVHTLTWHVRALSAAPLQKAMSVSNYPPYPCVLLSFCLPLPCGIVGRTLTWHVRALTWHVRALTCARPHLACVRPLRAPLSKKQCRCPTTPLIRAYCCLFAFRYLVG